MNGSPYELTQGPDVEHAAFAPLGPSLYEYKNRPRRDTWVAIVYLVFVTLATIGSIAAFSATDGDAIRGKYTSEFYQNSTSCSLPAFQESLPAGNATGTDTFATAFTTGICIWIPVSVVCGVLASIIYLYLFRNHALKMVYVSVYASVGFTLGIAVLSLVTGNVGAFVILLVFGLIAAALFWWSRDHLKLCGELLAVSGRALKEVPTIIPTAIGIKLAGVGIMVYLLAGFICGVFVGEVQKNSGRALAVSASGDIGICLNQYGQAVDCCSHSTKGWAVLHCVIAAITISWTTQVLLQLKLYMVADTVAQWYFRPAGSAEPSARRGLLNGLTSSFGSICLAAAIMMVINWLRRALDNAQRDSEGAMRVILCIINCFAQCILSMLEAFTRFATISSAITGKAFIPAAKDLFQLLKRNLLATYSVWWIPDMVLGISVFLMSLAWAGIVFFSTYLQWVNRGYDSGTAVGLGFAVAAVAVAVMGFILHFVASILLDGVDTIYVCFAMDRDSKVVTHPEIHHIYEALPTVPGAVIEQPDGGVMYGAPAQQPGSAQAYPHVYPQAQPQAYPQVYPQAYYQAGQPHAQPGYAAQPPAYGSYPPVTGQAPPSWEYPPASQHKEER